MPTSLPVPSYSHAPAAGWLASAFSVLRAGQLRAAAGASLVRSRHAGQDVLYCVKGRGEIESSGRRFAVASGQVAWLANEGPHAHRADLEDPWQLLWLRLDGPAAPRMRVAIFGENEHVRDVAEPDRLNAWFQRLFATLDRRDQALDLELNQLAAALFLLLGDAGGSDRRAGLPKAVARTIEAMRADLADPWPAAALEGIGGVSATHLRRLFVRHVGLPPHRWLMRERMLRAQTLLADTDLAVGEIGVRCGFADVFHFSREFKRHLGASPAHWRRAERAF